VRERGTMRLGDEQHPAEIVMVAVHEGPLAGNVVVMRQDVIAQQQLEDALRASEARYRAIIESSPDALWILDPSGTILDTNPQGCRLAGLTREELVGANLQEFVPPETLVGLQELVSVVLARGMGSRDLTFTQRDGTLMHVNASVLALTLDGQQVILSFIRNISRRVQAEQALVFAKEEAEAASRAKSAFLAAMSHELRTPLNAILGYAEVLQMSTDAELTQRQRRWVQRIESSGRHLLELINDILDVARIEAGEEQLTLQPVDVADVCERSTQFVRTQALKMQLSLSLDLQHAPAQLLADERRLLQILVNLLSNAVKFTPEGGRIGLSVTPDAERAEVWFTVWDTGIGIAEDDLPRLFRPFEQLDTRLAREYEGSGLGLALVRRLTELHGGRVVVESAVGRGSHFTAILPWHVSEPRVPREAAKPADTPAPGVDSVPVLVVDDDTASRMVVVDYLTALGYRVREAVSAEAALALLAEELPAVVLMDIQMPQMDGLEAIRRIRAQPRLNGVPIIALTALAMSEDRERCLAAGADAYMSKPVRLSELAEMLASLR
jgi:PAS domain S-box-containing protein